MLPVSQMSAGVQLAPAVQEMQSPLVAPLPSQTAFVPQLVPAATGVAGDVSTQAELPVLQEVTPAMQLLAPGLVAQLAPGVHGLQLPLSQKRSVPQLVPLAPGLAPVSLQTTAPVEQETLPVSQTLLGVQAWPTVQETQSALVAPVPSQTAFVPQLSPAVAGVAGEESTQTATPLVQLVLPATQLLALGLVEQLAPGVQGLQLPLSQNRSVPQLVPLAAGLAPVSLHTTAPVEQETLPVSQTLVGVQTWPTVQEMQSLPVSPTQTSLAPQVAPGARRLFWSTQTGAPLEQSILPLSQTFGVGWQDAPCTQAPQSPLSQTSFVPQVLPF